MVESGEVEVHVKSLITGETTKFKGTLDKTLQWVWDEAYARLEEQKRAGDTFRCADGDDLTQYLPFTLAQLKQKHVCEDMRFEIRGPSGGAV